MTPNQLELYGALSLWMVVAPEKFGRKEMSSTEMLAAADRASKELRLMFHEKPLKPWQARKQKRGPAIFQFARRRMMSRGNDFVTDP